MIETSSDGVENKAHEIKKSCSGIISKKMHDSIDFQKGGLENLEKNKYDIILANINKNVLLEHLLSYKMALRDTGLILLSGFLDEDKEVILKVSEELKRIK